MRYSFPRCFRRCFRYSELSIGALAFYIGYGYKYVGAKLSDRYSGRVEGKFLDLSVSGRTILLGKAVDRVELYNVSGCLISLTENSNHISAPGIGMYIVRIVTEGKVFSQKIWINR